MYTHALAHTCTVHTCMHADIHPHTHRRHVFVCVVYSGKLNMFLLIVVLCVCIPAHAYVCYVFSVYSTFFQTLVVAHPKKISGLALHLILHHLSPFICEVSFGSLIKGITLKICVLCFVLKSRVLFNQLCVWNLVFIVRHYVFEFLCWILVFIVRHYVFECLWS